MSTGEVLFFRHMTMCGWLPPYHEGAADCRPDRHLVSVCLCKSSSARLHSSSLSHPFQFRDKKNVQSEPPAKRVKRTHRGWRSSAAQEKRDQRNEWCYPGSFAFAWLAQNCGTASCSVDQQVMEMTERLRQNEESAEEARQLLEAHRTAGQMLEE